MERKLDMVTPTPSYFANSRIAPLAFIVVLQGAAAAYFIVDGFGDLIQRSPGETNLQVIMDWVVAFALIAGLYFGARLIGYLSREISRKDETLNLARGAIAEHVARRFAEWGLTAGEADVALFAMKGYGIAEIAELRKSASGTVRAQLSQIYAKADVKSQSMLVSLVIEDLLDNPPVR
jgi:DNA-binding CsgD family transcriptional regulator